MKKLPGDISFKENIIAAAPILLLTLLFFILHFDVFFSGYYRPHGDFTGIHFSANYIINALCLDHDIPVWQPYLGLGGPDTLSYLSFHPLIAAFAATANAAAAGLAGAGYSFFKVTFFSFLLAYVSAFAYGCYLLAKDHISDRYARLAVFAMALFGTHIYFTVYALSTSVFYLPFLLLFFFRHLKGDRTARNTAGAIIALGLWLSSTTAYFGQLATLLILLFGAAALLRPWEARLVPDGGKPFRPVSVLAAALLLVTGMLMVKGLLALRMEEVTSAHRVVAAKTSYIRSNLTYLNGVSLKPFTNDIRALLGNLIDNWGGTPALQSYSGFPRLYYGLFPILALGFFWRRLKGPLPALLAAMTLALFLASTNPQDGYNFILPLMVFLNPLLAMSTRHINFPVVFAAPFLILALGLAIDALIKSKNDNRAAPAPLPWIAAALLLIFAAARLSSGSVFPRYCAAVLPLTLLIIYFPSRSFPRLAFLPGAMALLLISAELFFPFRNYAKTFYEPFGDETQAAARFGQNLPRPGLRGFPAPFEHSFSYWFDDKGLVTTADNYPGHNNAAFKFFSASRPELFNLPGLFMEDMPYMRDRSERLFIADAIVPAKSTDEALRLTEEVYKNGRYLSAAVIEGATPADLPQIISAGIPRERRGPAAPAQASVFLPPSAFSRSGADGKNASIKLFRARLPSNFPEYLTSNFLNRDAADIELAEAGTEAYGRTYFDVFDRDGLFQVNFREKGTLTISGPPPAKGLTLKWKDRFGAAGIAIKSFGYNSAVLEVKRDAPGFLVYMDRYHPRWRAFIDGKRVELYRTNGQFKGVAVPQGAHEVRFQYSDTAFKLGVLISTVAHLLGVVAVFWLAGKRSQASPAKS